MTELPRRRVGSQANEKPNDVVAAAVERTTELDREWTERRLEAYRVIDASVHESIGNVLKTAVDVRQAMEQEARLILDALRTDRDRIVEEIRDLRRERDEITSDMLGVRRQAEEDSVRIRVAAETQAAAILTEAETRRAALLAEVSQLDKQVTDVSGQFQSLFDEAALRSRAARSAAARTSGGMPTPLQPSPLRVAEPENRPNAPARSPVTPAAVRPVAAKPPPAPVASEPSPFEPTSVEPKSPPAGTRSRVTPPPAAGAPAQQPTAAQPPPVARPRTPIDAVLPAIAPENVPPDERSASIDVALNRTTVESVPASKLVSTQKTNVGIAGIPSFSRAIEIQRAIQRSPVVRHVQGLGLEHGRFTIAVEHDPGVDLSATIAQELRIDITVLSESDGNLELNIGG